MKTIGWHSNFLLKPDRDTRLRKYGYLNHYVISMLNLRNARSIQCYYGGGHRWCKYELPFVYRLYTNKMFLDILLPYSVLSWRKTVWIYFSPPLTVNEKKTCNLFTVRLTDGIYVICNKNLIQFRTTCVNYCNIQCIKYMLYCNIIDLEFNMYIKSSSRIKLKSLTTEYILNVNSVEINALWNIL